MSDLLEQLRICDDMLHDGMEFTSGPDEPWQYGPFTIHRRDPEGRPAYLQIRDFDGVSQGLLKIKDFEDAQELRAELEDRKDELMSEL